MVKDKMRQMQPRLREENILKRFRDRERVVS